MYEHLSNKPHQSHHAQQCAAVCSSVQQCAAVRSSAQQCAAVRAQQSTCVPFFSSCSAFAFCGLWPFRAVYLCINNIIFSEDNIIIGAALRSNACHTLGEWRRRRVCRSYRGPGGAWCGVGQWQQRVESSGERSSRWFRYPIRIAYRKRVVIES